MAYSRRISPTMNELDLFAAAASAPGGPDAAPITVGALTRNVKSLIGDAFCRVCVVGEVSGLSVQRSGHAYFTLKDPEAQLPAVMWGSTYARQGSVLANGVKVVCFGRLDVYVPHGRYQMYVDRVEPVGVGSLEQRRKELHRKLGEEGLFLQARKKPLPLFVKRVGVATSPTGAALRDFLNILRGFSKCVEVVVAPTRVQGTGAGQEIANAVRTLDSLADTLKLDAIALIRGGGSVEDLWEFNEEAVVRAVAASHVPVISGVGHEIDTQLCDLAADIMAPTPTAAANEIVKRDKDFLQTLSFWTDSMRASLEKNCQKAQERLVAMEKRPIFREPGKVIWERKLERLTQIERRLNLGVDSVVKRHDARFREAVGRLEAMSPLAVLSRGYSITSDAATAHILRSTDEVAPGKTIETRLSDGVVRSLVMDVQKSADA